MTGAANFSERYRATLFVCVFQDDAARTVAVRGWGQLAAEFAPRFGFVGTHGETLAERASRTLAQLAWDRDETGEIAFLAHEFTSGCEAYVTALRTSGIPIQAADWLRLERDLHTPFASLDDIAATLEPGEAVEVGGGIDTTAAWIVREVAAGKPRLAVFRTWAEAEARVAQLRAGGAL